MKINLKPNSFAVFFGALTKDTVSVIKKLIRESKYVPEVRRTVENILFDIPERNWKEEILSIYEYVKINIRYTQDIEGIEQIKTPLRHITDIEVRSTTFGDCDDHVVLLGSLLVNAGYQIKIIIIRSKWNESNEFNHIYLAVNIPGSEDWLALDATAKDKPIGFEPEYKEIMSFNI